MAANDLHQARRRRLIRGLKAQSIDGLLVTDPRNVRYLSGFKGEDSALLVTPHETALLTDGRYSEQAQGETRGIAIRVRHKSLMEFAAAEAHRAGLERLGVEAQDVTLAQARALERSLTRTAVKPASGMVEGLRIVKDRTEVAEIRRAVAIAEEAFRATASKVRPGATELELARLLDRTMEDLGADGPAFATIVAAGERCSLPHARPTNRRIGRNDAVLFDWGAAVNGYHSDLTRLVFVDRIPQLYRRLYDAVLEAQRRAIAQLRPGRRAGSIDASARAVLKARRLNKHFTHGLGHGLGLRIHETPVLGAGSQTILRPGMVFTVEPGVYLPGRGGVRIEDDVLITRTGHATLTSLPKSRDAFLVRVS